MPLAEDILALVQQLPEIDAPPPVKPAPPLPPGEKPKPEPQHWKGKFTGPTWADAQKIFDKILAAGQDGVAAVIDLIKTPDTAPDHKPRYVLNGLATYVCRPGMEKQRALVNAAIVSRLADAKPKMMRANLARALGLDPKRVGIKATTNEGMGFLGRGEGIAAMAVASVEAPE